MLIFANIMLDPAAIAGWIFAGLACGWLAGKMMEEPSYGLVGNLVLGGLGGLIGGMLWGYFRPDPGFWLSVVVAAGAAWVFILAGRTVVAMRSE